MDSEKDLQGNMHERKKIAKSKMITLCSVIAVFAIVFDQLTKYAAMTRLKDGAAFVLIDKTLLKKRKTQKITDTEKETKTEA